MNRQEVIEEFVADAAFRKKWESLIDDGTLERMLKYAECFRYPFNSSAIESNDPHIQTRRDGGYAAWEKLSELLFSMPKDEKYISIDKAYQQNDDFVRSPELPKRKSRFHQKH